MSENNEVTCCLRCGKEVHKNTGGLYFCIDKNCGWRGYSCKPQPQPATVKEGKPGAVLTSGQIYRVEMQNALGYKDERNVYRLIDRLGNVQVSPVISGSIEITIYPGGGEQRVPLAQGTKTVDINNVQEIHLDGKYPYAIVDIVQNCSGQPVTVTCHVKS